VRPACLRLRATPKIDDSTIEITTRPSTRSFPIRCCGSWSRAREYESSARTGTVREPAFGHRTVQIDKMVPRELAELSKNADVLGQEADPKSDKVT